MARRKPKEAQGTWFLATVVALTVIFFNQIIVFIQNLGGFTLGQSNFIILLIILYLTAKQYVIAKKLSKILGMRP